MSLFMNPMTNTADTTEQAAAVIQVRRAGAADMAVLADTYQRAMADAYNGLHKEFSRMASSCLMRAAAKS